MIHRASRAFGFAANFFLRRGDGTHPLIRSINIRNDATYSAMEQNMRKYVFVLSAAAIALAAQPAAALGQGGDRDARMQERFSQMDVNGDGKA